MVVGPRAAGNEGQERGSDGGQGEEGSAHGVAQGEEQERVQPRAPGARRTANGGWRQGASSHLSLARQDAPGTHPGGL